MLVDLFLLFSPLIFSSFFLRLIWFQIGRAVEMARAGQNQNIRNICMRQAASKWEAFFGILRFTYWVTKSARSQ